MGSSCSSPFAGADTATAGSRAVLPVLPSLTCSLKNLNPSEVEKKEQDCFCSLDFVLHSAGCTKQMHLAGGTKH